jgi:hypothetical protein
VVTTLCLLAIYLDLVVLPSFLSPLFCSNVINFYETVYMSMLLEHAIKRLVHLKSISHIHLKFSHMVLES